MGDLQCGRTSTVKTLQSPLAAALYFNFCVELRIPRYSAPGTQLISRGISNCTYVNDIVLGIMGIGAAHVQPIPLLHLLDHSNVVPAIEQLQNRELRINNSEISFHEHIMYCIVLYCQPASHPSIHRSIPNRSN